MTDERHGRNEKPKDPRVQKIQSELDETTKIIKKNVIKIAEREKSLEIVAFETGELLTGSQIFKKSASDLRRKQNDCCGCFSFWGNCADAVDDAINETPKLISGSTNSSPTYSSTQ